MEISFTIFVQNMPLSFRDSASLFVLFVLFVMFVMLRSLEPCVPQRRFLYRWKAFYEGGCTGFVSWRLDLQCERYWILKFLGTKNLENYFYFYISLYCGNNTGHTTLIMVFSVMLLIVLPIFYHTHLELYSSPIVSSFLIWNYT